MTSYPYIELPGIPKPVFKPWVKVVLGYKKTHKVTHGIVALIDSGADVCFCSQDIGAWLGVRFNKKSADTFTAANSTEFIAYKEMITLYACGRKYNCPFYFTKDLPKQTPIILGQIGFFDHFKVTFDLQNKMMEIF